MTIGDVRRIKAADLPGVADLVWASFPCQDLSLAGVGAGLEGQRSGALTRSGTWSTATRSQEGRAPRLVAVENVSAGR